nr:hypothetical protein [Tanacetum cinerariifolium]
VGEGDGRARKRTRLAAYREGRGSEAVGQLHGFGRYAGRVGAVVGKGRRVGDALAGHYAAGRAANGGSQVAHRLHRYGYGLHVIGRYYVRGAAADRYRYQQLAVVADRVG